MVRRDPLFRRVFGIPLLLAAAIIFGLVTALLGQGLWHVVSWIMLSIPIAVVAWHVSR
jgi:uncharacterized protein involved in cysteine biosynthesis